MVSKIAIILILGFLLAEARFRSEKEQDDRKWELEINEDGNPEFKKEAIKIHRNSRHKHSKTRRGLIRLNQKDNEEWEAFKHLHNRKFHSIDTENKRLMNFLKAKEFVQKHNEAYELGDISFKVEINSFSDLSHDEFEPFTGYKQSPQLNSKNSVFSWNPPVNATIYGSIDWSHYGYVTPVKYQGRCGSCYAFSAVGALEGQYKRLTGKLISLSEQNIVDCSRTYGNGGCKSGWFTTAFQYIKDNGGIDTAETYPYMGKEQQCISRQRNSGVKVTGYVNLPYGNEEQLKIAVATQGPISIAIHACELTFRGYKTGVYYEKGCSSNMIDHAMVAVGYGTDPKHGDYWLLKNSWGTSWGEQGYIRMTRNRNNNCGIASYASFPLIH
ncbi:hypothetical protein FO519_009597 [Halicephalobus sp. NKZ332]|nr:hypothetical protein FO519_009597 [Halicephalobus sp. NKZ332]